MVLVQHCPFCGRSEPAGSATTLAPLCADCGSPVEVVDQQDLAPSEGNVARAGGGLDSAGPLALALVVPWLLPLVGLEIRDVLLAVPLLFLPLAVTMCLAMARRPGEPAAAWRLYALTGALGAAGIVIGIAAAIAGALPTVLFQASALATAVFVAAVALHLRGRLRTADPEQLLAAGPPVLAMVAGCGYFVIAPGLADGDPLLTLVVCGDLVAAALAALLWAVADDDQERHRGRRILWLALTLLVADALVALDAAGLAGVPPEVSTSLYALAGWLLATAADPVAQERRRAAHRRRRRSRRPLVSSRVRAAIRFHGPRVALPTMVLFAIPAMRLLALEIDGPRRGSALWFGGLFLITLVVVFVRQSLLVSAHERASRVEREQARRIGERNQELEALTGLATTMTQTLEEAPIVEQALGVLHAAARASSSALHVHAHGRLKLRASAGRWHAEHPWADHLGDEETICVRGGRQVTRLRLRARGNDIGCVTFVRDAGDGLADRDLHLLRLLVDQMAIAVQNARDYREKLEQAIRDPLTGLYNRRYFFELLENEVQRSRRYGSCASVVVFDVDHFKRINDTRGHATGDDVLRGIAAVVEPLLRPVDTFARIGGEEFALLLPETDRFDALLVAERLRAAIGRARLVEDGRVTVSAGVGACPADAAGREDLLRRVDGALYWAKRNGRDMCALVTEATDGTVDEPDAQAAAVSNLVALVGAIDAQQLHTRDHSENVATYAAALGRALGLSEEHLVRLRRAALLHDVGKVAVRPEVLEKDGPLTDAEYGEIKLHPVVGATMLHHAGLGEEAAWVRHHHERYDGRGYPDALAGEDIPLESRIIFVADAFEAMTSDRPYRPGKSAAEALEELRRCAGSQFEPGFVAAFAALVEAGTLVVSPVRATA